MHNSVGIHVPDGMHKQMAVAKERIDWMVHKDTILQPRTFFVDIPESSSARNRRNAIKARREKLSRTERRARGEEVIGNHFNSLKLSFCIM